MRSVADEVRREQRLAERAMSPEQRVALALRLGEEGLRTYCAAHGLERREALRQIQERRQAGRRQRR